MDSLLCILMSWYTSKSSPEAVAQQIFGSKRALIQDKDKAEEEKRRIIMDCRQRSLSGNKIYTFCSDFIQDPGAVFHLPREIKALIVTIGLPNKSFRDIHETLARRLIDNGIQIHAEKSGGAEILRRMKLVVEGTTLRWHTPVVAGGAPTNTSAVALGAIPSQQREAMHDNEIPEAVTPVYQTTAFGASGLGRDEHISWNSSPGGGGDPCDAPRILGRRSSALNAQCSNGTNTVNGNVSNEPERDNIRQSKRRRVDQLNMDPLDGQGAEGEYRSRTQSSQV
ncbi:hypothetical protein LTR93_011300 [Exophiala xenobiotica]|nr:hypothetical protein LTR93_011300 [Exophiala xenobiotica]